MHLGAIAEPGRIGDHADGFPVSPSAERTRMPRLPSTRHVPAVLLATLVAACGGDPPPPAQRPPVDVRTTRVAVGEAPVTYEFIGQTESSHQVEIRARVAGFLDKRVYTEGAVVKPGQTLFVMDKKPFEAQLQAARAELAQQQARLDVARQNLARVRPLASKNALSKKDLDDAVGQEQAAAAAIEAARAKVLDAELNLGYCTITTPVAGISSFAKVQEGSYVNASNSLLTYVAKLDPMRVNFSLSENEALRVREEASTGALKLPGQMDFRVQVVLADGSEFPGTGRITFADAEFSQDTGTFMLRAEVPNPRGTLRPGQFVRLRLSGASRPDSVVLPQRAVLQGPRGEYVWVVNDGKAEQRAISVGQWIGDDWLIRKGLRAGDEVIVDGASRLTPGAAVKATPLAAAAAASGAKGTAAAPSASAPRAAASPGTSPPKSTTAPVAAVVGGAPLPLSLHFEVGSAVLPPSDARKLQAAAAWLAAHPDTRVALSGFTDKRGLAAVNARLAKERAQGVRSALVVAGVDEGRIVLQAPRDITGGDVDEQARRVDVRLP